MSMPTTVKIDPEFKKEIDKLQAKVTLKIGEKITQQELLVRIIQFIIRNEEEFFRNFIFDWKPLPDKEWEKMKAQITDFGKITKESTIDTEIYGD